MNMIMMIMSKRSAMFAVLCGLLLVLDTASASNEQQDLPDEFESVGDEKRQLDDEQLGHIVKDFGGHLQETMEAEMDRLLSEVQMKPSVGEYGADKGQSQRDVSAQELERLKEVNREAGRDIKARVELAGDTDGNLPQMGLGTMATSLAAAASSRLSAAGSYIGNKMRTLSNSVKNKIPAKLRRFFKWPTFLRFKIRFHKVYKSLREELYRQMIFLRSHIVVGMQHVRYLLGRDKHLNGQNQYSDWTEKEYFEKEGNHQAESGVADLDPRARRALEPKEKARLEELARSGKNIFGQPVGKSLEKSRKKRHAIERDEEEENQSKRQRRAKRSLESNDDEEMYDELDDSEDDSDLEILGNDLETDADPNPEDAFSLIDEFSQEIDLSGLDDIESNVDDALNANSNFTPIDLRQTGCLIRSENQNGCGCCYSYVINALASYYNCMESEARKVDRYHARFVSDCGKYMTPEDSKNVPDVNGCHGGRISKAYYFAQTVGVQRFPYYNLAQVSAQVVNDTCAYPRPPTTNLAEHGWRAIIEPVHMFDRSDFTLIREDEIDLHLRTVGPVTVNVNVWRHFKEYAGGIVANIEDADKANRHSMMIVGHDRDAKGRHYWIILNSHGIVWGENGYLRMYKDVLDEYAIIYGGLQPRLD